MGRKILPFAVLGLIIGTFVMLTVGVALNNGRTGADEFNFLSVFFAVPFGLFVIIGAVSTTKKSHYQSPYKWSVSRLINVFSDEYNQGNPAAGGLALVFGGLGIGAILTFAGASQPIAVIGGIIAGIISFGIVQFQSGSQGHN